MKVTYNWLKDFLEIKISPQALAEKLTMAGLEVTSLSSVSLKEKPGEDFVFEIEVTANRPDCLSVVGIAREVAAITGKKLKLPKFAAHQLISSSAHQAFNIRVENKKDCPLYIAKIIKGVKVGPSPEWLKSRLELMGCRSINNIVDITNYIMLAWGQPLHAFDLRKLDTPSIVVRRAKNNERLVTIDDATRLLTADVLAIADSKKAVAIAGIMGGKDTEVTEETQDVLLEAAVFNPVAVRCGRQKLGIQSESAYRFERGVNLEMTEAASGLAARLIHQIGGGSCILHKSEGIIKREKKIISLNAMNVNKILGSDISASCIAGILRRLDFKVRLRARSNFMVEIPSHRPDINLEVDLIEEIARIFGYENIPKTLPAVLPQISTLDNRDKIALIKNILAGLGLHEVITYSLIDRGLLRGFGLENAGAIEILNPLSREQEILRPTVIPSLCRAIAHNLNQKQDYINIFEIAKVFSASAESMPKEEFVLGIGLCGARSLWFGAGRIQDAAGFLHLKGICETLFKQLGIKQKEYRFVIKNSQGYEVFIREIKIGSLIRVDKGILENLDIKNREIFTLEITLDKFLPYIQLNKKFTPLPRYPGISRDISLVLKEEISVGQVMTVTVKHGGALLENVEATDYYRGKQIDAGFKGLTISCRYCSSSRTLTDAEVNPVHAGIIQGLKDELQAKIR